jgi:hypothetical protein
MEKNLKEKAIDIKGKKYVLVSDRVLYFNETYPNGSIETAILSEPNEDTVIIRATITPDNKFGRRFVAHSQATWDDGYINKTSALENAETSAVGRALGFMGIGVIESIASVDEIHKATTYPARVRTPEQTTARASNFEKKQSARDDSERDVEAFLNEQG